MRHSVRTAASSRHTALSGITAKLKNEFMNNAQALVHGDLHTGSIFVREDSTKVFDPEFAFYGPMGYDVGNVVANLIFAWNNGDATIEDEAERAAFTGWVENTISEVIDLFIQKFRDCWRDNATDMMAKTEGYLDWYLAGVLADTAAVAGLELNRRTVGMAQVKDITTIPDEAKRVRAERINIYAAKDFIMNRRNFTDGAAFVGALKKAVERVGK